ncbi:MAG: glyoxal reductase [Epulopiscium sp. Nele67-Bin002]|nr:MAG: glyoxal reductase [Epulopiscium sp. Nuni2H_MBin001]OON91368.1 MAG: glyoxal reductase [Epulopiscium sp. Nele67-Bin002]
MEFTLNNGVKMPAIGLGVFKSGDETSSAVKAALKAGYRQIDTAFSYKNETDVGIGIKESGVPRDEIFITTKAWNQHVRAYIVGEAYDMSLQNLGVDMVDLYLIHWPTTGYVEAWQAMEKIYEQNRVRAIGVSNFKIHHLQELEKSAKITPAVNQIESHPYFNNQETIDYCKERGIVITVYSPLGGQRDTSPNLLIDPTIVEVANKYNKTPAQVILRWQLQRGVVIIPKSKTESRIIENINIFDFELADEDMAKIFSLNKDQRFGSDPDNITF